MTLPELRNLLDAYADHRVAEPEFRAGLCEAIVSGAPEFALPGGPLDDSASERLATELLFHFDEPGCKGETLQVEAAAVVSALDELPPPAILELLPLFWRRERVAEVVEKYRQGIVSRTSLVAAISAAGLGMRLATWVLGADAPTLDQLATCLRREELLMLHRLTAPAAA